MINPNPRQQCCPKCYWKNPMIQSSDIRIGQYDNCPRCGSKLKILKFTILKIVLYINVVLVVVGEKHY